MKTVYISASEEMKKRIKKSFARSTEVIYTGLSDAEYIIIERLPDGRFEREQFRDLVVAQAKDKTIMFAQTKVQTEKEMRATRKRLDMEIE